MNRLHLFELEDQAWFPRFLRDYGTDFLEFVSNQFHIYRPAVDLLKKGLEKSGGTTIIDLASGGGGGWKRLATDLQAEVPDLKVIQTDYFPNLDAFAKMKAHHPEIMDSVSEPVSALDVPSDLKGLRTQFLSFHHFKPDDAQQILQNAVDSNAPIAIFEAQERDWKHFIQFCFSPINVLLVTPFIRPFKIGRLIFTYLIPLMLPFIFWDGIVSVLRTYTEDEMREMTAALRNAEHFEWEIGKLKSGPFTIPYLLGYPK